MATRTQRTLVASSKHCVSLLARLATRMPPDTSEPLFRRECYRWALSTPAAIRYASPEGPRVTVDATVEDISGTGIGLICSESLSMGQEAEVFVLAEGKTYSATARVTHLQPHAEGFRVGCEFVVREDE